MNLLSSREESVFLALSGKHLRSGIAVVILAFLMLMSSEALAHAVAQGDKGYIQEITGTNIVSFIYLGAKHMVTGYDHVLFLQHVNDQISVDQLLQEYLKDPRNLMVVEHLLQI